MSVIKSIELLSAIISQSSVETLEQRALLHRRFSNIEFKILSVKDGALTIRVVQGKSPSNNQFDGKRLNDIANELFEGVDLPDIKAIYVRPIQYSPSPTEVVNAEWIRQQFERTGISLKQAGIDLGVDPNTLSAYRAGLKPLSGITKAALFYYFKSL